MRILIPIDTFEKRLIIMTPLIPPNVYVITMCTQKEVVDKFFKKLLSDDFKKCELRVRHIAKNFEGLKTVEF